MVAFLDGVASGEAHYKTLKDGPPRFDMPFKTEGSSSGSQVNMAAMLASGTAAFAACTALWDLSFYVGNVFAVPGVTDNVVCGLLVGTTAYAGTRKVLEVAIPLYEL